MLAPRGNVSITFVLVTGNDLSPKFNFENAHDAIADVEVTMKLMKMLVQRNSDLFHYDCGQILHSTIFWNYDFIHIYRKQNMYISCCFVLYSLTGFS